MKPMNILITGAAGFVGKNLTCALQNIKDGKDRTHPGITPDELYLYDVESPADLLETACEKADFVFHLAGVNRPKDPADFMAGNFGFRLSGFMGKQIVHKFTSHLSAA